MFLHQLGATRLVRYAVAMIATSSFLTGCSGSQPFTTTPGLPQSSNAVHSILGTDMQAKCPVQKGAVRVTPCKVRLSPSNPGPITLTLKTPHGSKGSIKQHGGCGAKGIATISGSGHSWTVTAGSNPGTCRATFVYFNNGHRVQFARAFITNSV